MFGHYFFVAYVWKVFEVTVCFNPPVCYRKGLGKVYTVLSKTRIEFWFTIYYNYHLFKVQVHYYFIDGFFVKSKDVYGSWLRRTFFARFSHATWTA
jgi:hypothetical protein